MSRAGEFRVPFHKPSYDEAEIQSVSETIRSGWITTGPKVKEFEESFARQLGVKHALALNSGTAAMHLSLEALGIKEGDEVITVPFTFVATSEVILYCRAKPVYVDCDPDTFNILADQIEEKITAKTKAILPVHFAGQACDMDRLQAIAAKHGLKIIEDAAHSFPTAYKGKKIGTFGDATCFSFYATKTLSTGEGGMLVTPHDEVAEKAKLLSLHGITRDAWKRYQNPGAWRYDVVALGHKYNMSDLQAAIGIEQLKKTPAFLESRRRIAKFYHKLFADSDLLKIPAVNDFDGHAWHLYVIQLELGKITIGRDEFIRQMGEAGIGTSVHFVPLCDHPFYKDKLGLRPEDFPNAMGCFHRIVSLPIYPAMTDEDAAYVGETVLEILRKNSIKKAH